MCGMMRAEDALAAGRVGADAIGLIFHPGSARNLTIERAREIVESLPAFVTAVGVFVDANVEAVEQTCGALGIRHVQLSGHESPRVVGALREFTVTKAVRVEAGKFEETLREWKN